MFSFLSDRLNGFSQQVGHVATCLWAEGQTSAHLHISGENCPHFSTSRHTTNVKKKSQKSDSFHLHFGGRNIKIPTNVKIIQIKSSTSEGEKTYFWRNFFSPTRLICYHPCSWVRVRLGAVLHLYLYLFVSPPFKVPAASSSRSPQRAFNGHSSTAISPNIIIEFFIFFKVQRAVCSPPYLKSRRHKMALGLTWPWKFITLKIHNLLILTGI